MATIDPYRQRTSRPTNTSPTQGGVSTQVTNAAAAGVAALGQTAQQIMAPRLERAAKKEALADFAATGELAKDENGNYVIPETPKGGQIYQAAFEAAAAEQFVIQTTNDAEAYFNDLYSDPKRWKENPEIRRQEAVEYTRGLVAGAPPELRQTLLNQLTREIKQRDYAASTKAQTIALKEMEAGYAASVDKLGNELRDLHTLDQTDEVLSRIALHEDDLLRQAALLAQFRGGDSYLEQVQQQVEDFRGYGEILRAVEAQVENVNPLEIERLAMIVEGDMIGSAMGMDNAFTNPKIESRQIRAQLGVALRRRAGAIRAERNMAAREAQLQKDMGEMHLGRKPLETGTAFAKRALPILSKMGIDPYTVQGMYAAAEALGGDLPPELYTNYFDNVPNYSVEQLDEKLELYNALRNATNPMDGSPANYVPKLDDDDKAFLYHYELAKRNGILGDDGKAVANDAITNKLFEGNRTETVMMDRFGVEDFDEVIEQISPIVGGNWNEQTPEVRKYLIDSVAQLVNRKVPPEKAIELVDEDFQKNYVKDPYVSDSYTTSGWGDVSFAGVSFSDGVIEGGIAGVSFTKKHQQYVARENAIPASPNPANPKDTNSWVKDLLPVVKELAGQQVEGFPGWNTLEVGRNIKFVPTTVRGKNSKMFRVEYIGSDGVQTLIQGQDGRPLVLDLGRAAALRNDAVSEVKKEIASETSADQMMLAIRELREIIPIERINAQTGQYSGRQVENMKNMPSLLGGSDAVRSLWDEDAFSAVVDKYDLSERAQKIVAKNAAKLAVDPEWLKVNSQVVSGDKQAILTQAMGMLRGAESSGEDDVPNALGSSAFGRYQFTKGTWLEWFDKTYPQFAGMSERQKLMKRLDGKTQDEVMVNFTLNNMRLIEEANQPLNMTNVYIMHHFGVGDGPNILVAPENDSIANHLEKPSKVFKKNPHLLWANGVPKTVREVRQELFQRMYRHKDRF